MDENNNDNSATSFLDFKCLLELEVEDLFKPSQQLGDGHDGSLEDYLNFEIDENIMNFCIIDDESCGSSATSCTSGNSEEENINKFVSYTKSGRKKDKQCPICFKLFSTNPKLKIHLRVHTHEKPFACRFCPKKFSQQFNWARHEQTHSAHPEKRYQCHHCGLRFNQSCSLKDHFFSHENVMHFECPTCAKQFKQKSNLRTHIYLVHQRKLNPPSYKCQFCDKTFRQRNNLKSHENIHKNIKPFQCRHCQLSFTSAAGLYIHNRSCTGEEIQCTQCRKSFKSQESYRKHLLLHSGSPLPYRCDICSLTFQSQSNVTRHKKSVHDLQAYTCHKCNEIVTSKSVFRLHQRSHRRK